jgi:hypothetical protein
MICILAVCSFAFGLYIALHFVFRFHPQTVQDVIALARFVDQKELEDLASAVIEDNLRASLPARRFQTEQRKRAIMLLEYLRRMSYNSWVILAWAYQLQDRSQGLGSNDSLTVAIADALAAAAPVRFYSLMVLPSLALRILLSRLRIVPLPTLATAVRVKNRSMAGMYDRLVNTAILLAGSEGADTRHRLARILLGDIS